MTQAFGNREIGIASEFPDVLGESESDLSSWPSRNGRCNPPWSDKELRHNISDARKKFDPGKVGSKLKEEPRSTSKKASKPTMFETQNTPQAQGRMLDRTNFRE
jgi:hypothetical protein